MIRAKSYETVSNFVKAMPRIMWVVFSGHGVYRQRLHTKLVPRCMWHRPISATTATINDLPDVSSIYQLLFKHWRLNEIYQCVTLCFHSNENDLCL